MPPGISATIYNCLQAFCDNGTILPQFRDLAHIWLGFTALFCVHPAPESVKKEELLAVRQIAAGSTTWQAKTANGTLTLLPFTAIDDQHYRLYLKTVS